MTIQEKAREMKLDAPLLAATSDTLRNAALRSAKEGLLAHAEEIFAANRLDLENAQADGVPAQVMGRLKFNEKKLQDVCAGIDQLISLPDPLGKVLLKRQLDEGLVLTRISVPIGVIGVIFEARPDALVQISTLCLKSGNCAILKGGKETVNTNRALYEVIHDSFVSAGMPPACLMLAEQRSEIDELLGCDGDVDLLIPRGSNRFVRYIMEHTKIPVMGHADGVCHIYVDEQYDTALALRVITDAKIQYAVACNAVETVLVNRKIAKEFLPLLWKCLKDVSVSVRATREVLDMPDLQLEGQLLEPSDFHHEYGDLILSVVLVENVEEAVSHINRYGSHHTDSIITENDENAAYFFRMVDSAGVYRNCSTRFADGFRYGFGAEVGISTSKLHARGPVGLEGLVTYKYLLEGSGQTVGDYASGKSSFHFKDL